MIEHLLEKDLTFLKLIFQILNFFHSSVIFFVHNLCVDTEWIFVSTRKIWLKEVFIFFYQTDIVDIRYWYNLIKNINT